jgi:hypothetical protein
MLDVPLATLLFEFLDITLKPGNFDSFFFQLSSEVVRILVIGPLSLLEFQIEVMVDLLEIASLPVPILSLLILPIKPGLMFILKPVDIILQLLDLMAQISLIFFIFKVQSFNFLVLIDNLSFQLSNLIHQLFFVQSLLLHLIGMLNECQGHFRGLILMLFFVQGYHILQLLVLSLIFDLELIESILVVSSHIQIVLHLLGQ